MSRQRHDSFFKDAFALWLAPLRGVPLIAATRLGDAPFTKSRDAPTDR